MLYTDIIRPLLFRYTDPESIHHRVIRGLGAVSRTPGVRSVIERVCTVSDPRLTTRIGKIELQNPIGLAAGFDKYIDAPLAYPMLGFGFAELGSITGKEQPGNPTPRLWRLPADHGLIVYYGLANAGVEKTATKLTTITTSSFPYGISIAPTTGTPLEAMAQEYAASVLRLHSFASYMVLNVSCPNVAACDAFAQITFIETLIKRIAEVVATNHIQNDIYIKIGPHHSHSDLDRIVAACLTYGITGIVATNLIKQRNAISFNSSEAMLAHPGGISGDRLRDPSNATLAYLYKQSHGALTLIGLGGVFTAADAYQKIRLGASAVEIITGFIYGGPLIVRQINSGLAKLLTRDGFATLHEAIGIDVK